MAVASGEAKARALQCRTWAAELNKVHGDAWEITQVARTSNVVDLARTLTALTVVVRGMALELDRWMREDGIDG